MQQKISKINSSMIFAYFLFIFGIYPLLTKEGYICLADFKYKCFITPTVIFIVLLAVGIIARNASVKDKCSGLNALDWAIIVYGALVIVSYAASDYKKMAFLGADGWYMGLLSQLVFVALYFVISRGIKGWNIDNELIIIPIMVLSVVAVGIGILQCAGVDMFGWYNMGYDGLEGLYFSTMGQISWYGAYLTLFNGFATVFMWCAMDNANVLGEQIDASAWKIIAIIYKAIMLIGLVLIKAQAGFGVIGIIFIADIIFIFWRKEKNRYLCKWILGASVLMVLLVALFGLLNTIGVFGEGYHGMEGLLYYDKGWGNNRGSIWVHSANVWKSLGTKQKIFGVGPDCFMQVAYSIDSSELGDYIGNSVLQNAHNEWFNSIICLGILGGISYLTVFGISIGNGIEKLKENKNYLCDMAAVLIICIYGFYGCFCYQQCYSTPMIFIIIAIYEGRLRSK